MRVAVSVGGRRSAAATRARTRSRSSPRELPPSGSSFERCDGDDEEAVEEAVGELGRGEVAEQLVFGDVADDPDVRVGGAQRRVAADRLQPLAVPGVADDRTRRVALAGEDLHHLRELGLDHEPAFVGRRVGVAESIGSRTWAISPSPLS